MLPKCQNCAKQVKVSLSLNITGWQDGLSKSSLNRLVPGVVLFFAPDDLVGSALGAIEPKKNFPFLES